MAQKTINYNDNDFAINYEILNVEKKQSLVILHGWGSNKEIMKQAFSECFSDFKHIYIDMPGFGKSPNEIALKTKDYANIIKIFLSDENVICVIGHSFGGKVATLLDCDNLVLLSTSGILEEKPLKIRLKIALFKILKPFGGAKIRKLFVSSDAKSMNAGMYQTFKNVVNEDFSSNFSAFDKNAIVIWGKQDTAVSVKSGEIISKLIKNSQFFPLEGDHYFFLKQKKEVCDIISKNLKNLKRA